MAKKEEIFPQESKYPYQMEVEGEKFHETGITIRDDFAGRALQGIMATEKGIRFTPSELAKMCYDFADSMMKERQK